MPGTKQYFINGDGYLKGIRIDSVRTIGGNTVYYPFHTPRDTNGSVWGGIDGAGGSWVGKHVIADSAGVFYFDNFFGDTLIIRTLADSGNSWVFYNDPKDTNIYYRATVVSVDTLTILGTSDSIKRIQLQAYIDTVAVIDSINRFELVLSKNHGFQSVFDMYTFPYYQPGSKYLVNDAFLNMCLKGYMEGGSIYGIYGYELNAVKLAFKQVAYIYPDVADMYDYELGDGYRYQAYNYPTPGKTYHSTGWVKVTGKTIASMTETDYVMHSWKYTECLCYPPVSPTTSEGDFSLRISPRIIDSMKIMPEETDCRFVYWYRPEDLQFCFKSAYYGWDSYSNYVGEGCGDGFAYKVGIGLVDSGICYDATGPLGYSQWVTGARKNGIDCGLGVDNILTKRHDDFSVYPNPANEKINIIASAKIESIVISVTIYVLGQVNRVWRILLLFIFMGLFSCKIHKHIAPMDRLSTIPYHNQRIDNRIEISPIHIK